MGSGEAGQWGVGRLRKTFRWLRTLVDTFIMHIGTSGSGACTHVQLYTYTLCIVYVYLFTAVI